MSAAVSKRDGAIIAALGTYYTSVNSALTTRKTALTAAWLITDPKQREAAIKAAHEAFKGTWKKARNTMNDARKAAWKTFQTDAKACKAPPSASDAGAQGTDAQL